MAVFVYGKHLSHWHQIVPREGFIVSRYSNLAIEVKSARRDSYPSYLPDVAYQVKRFDEWLKDRKVRHVISHLTGGGITSGHLIFQHREDALMLKMVVDNMGRFGYD